MELKICKKCGIAQHPQEEYLYNSCTGYHSNMCKSCYRIKWQEDRKKKRGDDYDHTKAKDRQKKCKQCDELKPLDLEHFAKKDKAFSNTCRDCSGVKRDYKVRLVLPEFYGKLRKCSHCQEEKEVTDNFYYYKARNNYSYICKLCKVKDGKKYNNSVPAILLRYKNADQKKGLTDNDLTPEYVEESLKQPCTYCELESYGLDRLDNSKGHTIENTVPCCKECNVARNDIFTHEEMLIIGKAIKEVKLNRKNGINYNNSSK